MIRNTVLAVAIFATSSAYAVRAGNPFSVLDYGAAGDGSRLDTQPIQRAIDAAGDAGGGTVILPPGKYLSGTIQLKSHVTLDIEAGATLLASQNREDYPLVDDVWHEGAKMISPLIYADGAQDITITGRGTIDGQGEPWWRPILQAKGFHVSDTPSPTTQQSAANDAITGRPQLIRPTRCKDVVIEHVNLMNSPSWNIHPLLCENVRVDGVTITATVPSPNTDGINPESCRNVQIINCRIDTGDDCITLKSGANEAGRKMGRPDEDITIENCVMYHGHGGVTIGSETSGDVRNVTVSNCVFHGTDNGIRVKSQRGRGGVVEGLAVSNIVMQDVSQPFWITMFYSGRDTSAQEFPFDEGTPKFRDFIFSNITARGARTAGSITGLHEMPIENITFNNIHVQTQSGLTCTDAKNIVFQDVVIDTDKGPAIKLRTCDAIDTARLKTTTPHEGTPLVDNERSLNEGSR